MKYVKIFLLHFQEAIDERSRMLVWFLISLINPLVYLLFWRGASINLSPSTNQWQLPNFASYYMLLILASSFLRVHIEEYIAYYDIELGYLSNNLLKPVSYFWYQFFHELPYRFVEASFGVVVFLLFLINYPGLVRLTGKPEYILLSILILVGGYFLSYLLKIILGLSALFTTDFRGLAEFIEVMIIVFGGFVIPLDLFPDTLKGILSLLPFPYMFYYPVVAFLGRLSIEELVRVLVSQIAWIGGFAILYTFIWKKGIRLFTGVGR